MLGAIQRHLLLPTPVERFQFPGFESPDCELFIKRDDLIHPHVCGNKWRKLKFNLDDALRNKHIGLLSFGGGFSNHLVALAAACKWINVRSIGIIRSHSKILSNPTTHLLTNYGMQLKFVPPKEYAHLNSAEGNQQLINTYPDYYMIPEGGTNALSMRGVAEMMDEINWNTCGYTHIVVGVGTGGTLAGIINSSNKSKVEVIGISPFKGSFSNFEGQKYLTASEKENLNIIPSSVHSKFGSFNEEIVQYIKNFKSFTGILLDPVYTARVFMTVEKLLREQYFPKGSKVLIIHSGGLQGIKGFEFRYNCKLSMDE